MPSPYLCTPLSWHRYSRTPTATERERDWFGFGYCFTPTDTKA
jgi:hypothetical protein